jgi:hypothetical protein
MGGFAAIEAKRQSDNRQKQYPVHP